MFGGLLDETIQYVHACGEDIEILENFAYLDSEVHNDCGSSQEPARRIGVVYGILSIPVQKDEDLDLQLAGDPCFIL